MASIRDSESSRLAGWGIDHAGPLTAWVCLTGDDPPGEVASRLAERHSDVEIRTGATYSYAELRAVQAQTYLAQVDLDTGDTRTGSKVSVRIAYAGVDMSGNSVDVAIDPVIVPNRIPRGTDVMSRSVSDAVFKVEQARVYARTVAPTVEGLQANLGSDGVSLSWSVPVGDVVSYEVYRRAAVAGQSYEMIGTPSANTYQDPLSGLTLGVEYYYRIKAVNGDGLVGSWGSASSYARTVAPAVEGLQANLGSDGVSLSWSVPVGDVVSYEVYRRAAVAGQSYEMIGAPSANTYQDPLSGLTPGVEYYYRVKAENGDGLLGSWGPGSNYARTVTPAVEGLKTTIYSNGVSLAWATTTGDVSYYEVYRRIAKPGESYQKVDHRTESPFWDPLSGLTPGTEYWYRIKAVTSTGAVGSWGAGANYTSAVIPAVP